MSNLSPEAIEKINSLGGTALRVFLYALKRQSPVGVRETQRALGLKSPSHANYHLQRLVQLNLLRQIPGTKYLIQEEFKTLRTIKISLLTEVYLFKGWVVPSIGLLAGYSLGVLLTTFLLYFLVGSFVSFLFSSVSLFTLSGWSIKQAVLVLKSIERDY